MASLTYRWTFMGGFWVYSYAIHSEASRVEELNALCQAQ